MGDDVLFSRTFLPRRETFGSFLKKILNLQNRLPVDKYRVSYETDPFVLRKGLEDKYEEGVTIRQKHVETGPLTIQVSDLIIPNDTLYGSRAWIGDPLTTDENGYNVVLSAFGRPEVEEESDGERTIYGEAYREILVSVNDTVIGHFMAETGFPDSTSPAFEDIVNWIRGGFGRFKETDEALSTLSIAEELLPTESLNRNIPRSRSDRQALLEQLKGLEYARYPDEEDGADPPTDIPFSVKIEALSTSNKEHPNAKELREEEEDFKRGLIDAGKGAGYSSEEIERQYEEGDFFATRRELLRERQEAGQTTYEEYMRNYQKVIEQDVYEDLREGFKDNDPTMVGAVPTDSAFRTSAREQAEIAIDQIRKRRLPDLPGDSEEEESPDEKRLRAEARMALMETKGDVRAAARLIKKWRASMGRKL